MVAVSAKLNAQALRSIQARLKDQPQRTHRVLSKELNWWGSEWHKGVSDRFGRGGSLTSRSGMLLGGMGYEVTGSSLASLKLRNTSRGTNYSRQRQFGGVIKPTGGRKFLTIPTDANKTPAGVARISALALEAENPGRTFLLPTKSGGFVLMVAGAKGAVAKDARKHGLSSRYGARGNAVAMFYLVREVDQPGPRSVKHPGPSKLGFFEEWNARKGDRAVSLQRVARILAKRGSGG